jgi:hypothetical protein
MEEKTKLSGGASHKIRELKNRPDRPTHEVTEKRKKESILDKTENFLTPIIDDVIIPSAQDTFIDIVNGIADGIVNGIVTAITGRESNYSVQMRRHGTRGTGQTNYNLISRRNHRGVVSHDTDIRESTKLRNLSVDSKVKATNVIERMYEYIDDYGQISINELYAFDEIQKTCPYTYQGYGWKDIGHASIINNGDGTWGFDLPQPKPLR